MHRTALKLQKKSPIYSRVRLSHLRDDPFVRLAHLSPTRARAQCRRQRRYGFAHDNPAKGGVQPVSYHTSITGIKVATIHLGSPASGLFGCRNRDGKA